MTMALEETLTQLEVLGTDKMRAQNTKHGASYPVSVNLPHLVVGQNPQRAQR